MTQINKLINLLKTTEGNNRDAIYNAHIYWAQKPFNIISILIEELSNLNDVILDPFMGSGVTLIEALKLDKKRKVIGNDINEFPVFLVENLIKNYNINNIKNKFNIYTEELKNKIGNIYYTKCKKCNKLRTADRFLFHQNDDEFILDNIKYRCKNCFGGNKKPIKKPDKVDYKLFNKQYKIKNYYFKDINLIENARISVQDGKKISDLFTSRALYVINKICEKINEEKNNQFRLFLKLTLSSILHLAKITDKRSNSQWLLWYPDKNCLEKNIINLFVKRGKLVIKALIAAKNEGLTNINRFNTIEDLKRSKKGYLLLNSPAQNLKKFLPKNSVDLIITDPPYVDQIPYSEYMQLYNGFLNKNFNLKDEIVISNSNQRKKDENNYFNLIDNTFENLKLILKDEKYLCIFFHDNNLKYWSRLIGIANNHNFKFIDQVHIHKNKKTIKNISNPQKSLQGDSIIFLKKKTTNNTIMREKNTLSISELKKKIKNKSEQIINDYNGATTAQLFDNGLLKLLINHNALDFFVDNGLNLISLIEENYDFNNGKWYKK